MFQLTHHMSNETVASSEIESNSFSRKSAFKQATNPGGARLNTEWSASRACSNILVFASDDVFTVD
jgi:hypothetical protein